MLTILWTLTTLTLFPSEDGGVPRETPTHTQVPLAAGGTIHAEGGWTCRYGADPTLDPRSKGLPFMGRDIICQRGDARVGVAVGCGDRDQDEAQLTLSEGDKTPMTVINMKCERKAAR